MGPLSRIRRGVRDELSKVENGGSGTADERVIGPSGRYVPPEMDKGGIPAGPPSPAPLSPNPSKEPAPGVQVPPGQQQEEKHGPDR
jgi:general secretion pathway protein D